MRAIYRAVESYKNCLRQHGKTALILDSVMIYTVNSFGFKSCSLKWERLSSRGFQVTSQIHIMIIIIKYHHHGYLPAYGVTHYQSHGTALLWHSIIPPTAHPSTTAKQMKQNKGIFHMPSQHRPS